MTRTIRFMLVAVILLWTPLIWGAISFDATSNAEGTSTSVSTGSHTVTPGTGSVGIVCVLGDVDTGSDNITSVTWNSVGMTQVYKKVTGLFTGARMQYMYKLKGVTTGVITATFGSSHYIGIVAASYKDVPDTNSAESATTNITAGVATTSLTTTVTTNTANDWLVLCDGQYDAGSAPGAGGGTTRRNYLAANGNLGLFDSNSALAAGSNSLITTQSASGTVGMTHTMTTLMPAGTVKSSFGLFLNLGANQ